MLYVCVVKLMWQEILNFFYFWWTKQSPGMMPWALFSFEKISDFGTVALSFVCGKYYPIID